MISPLWGDFHGFLGPLKTRTTRKAFRAGVAWAAANWGVKDWGLPSDTKLLRKSFLENYFS